ncbi:MAG TPA: hypothetical protein VEK08_02905 [Planctomycetota bacterium]|nr:hypothetical protein [Planctomycetota bacterium]
MAPEVKERKLRWERVKGCHPPWTGATWQAQTARSAAGDPSPFNNVDADRQRLARYQADPSTAEIDAWAINEKQAKLKLLQRKNIGAQIYTTVLGPTSELLLLAEAVPSLLGAGISSAARAHMTGALRTVVQGGSKLTLEQQKLLVKELGIMARNAKELRRFVKPPLDMRPFTQMAEARMLTNKTPSGTYNYVRDEFGNVYVGPAAEHTHPRILGGGRSATGSGTLTIKDGVITSIDHMSGTFRHGPEALDSVIESMNNLGIKVLDDAAKYFRGSWE